MNCHLCHEDDSMKSSCISKVPIFNHLTNEEMQEVMRVSMRKRFEKGEQLFRGEEPSKHLFIVHKGKVKIYRLSDSGKEQIIRFVEAGGFIGELSLFLNKTSEVYAEAIEGTEVCSIHQADIYQLIMKFPTISLKVLEEFSRRLNHAEMLIERLNTQDVEKRIASYLVELAEKQIKGPIKEPIKIYLPVSKKDVASFLGTTRETLSRRLSSFQELGWIELEGQRNITIVQLKELQNKTKGLE